MAEYEERSLDDLTEEPSPQRLEELRKKGTVPQSRDLTSTLVLLGVSCALYLFSNMAVSELSTLMREVFSKDLASKLTLEDWPAYIDFFTRAGKVLFLCFIPVALTAFLFGILGSIGQVGFMLSTEVLNPDFQRINPAAGFKKVYSMQSLVEGGKSFTKLCVVVTAVYLAISSHLEQFASAVQLLSLIHI